jgi:hypothetical protein
MGFTENSEEYFKFPDIGLAENYITSLPLFAHYFIRQFLISRVADHQSDIPNAAPICAIRRPKPKGRRSSRFNDRGPLSPAPRRE